VTTSIQEGPPVTDHHILSDSDWDVLVAVPFAVLFLVGYADGRLAPAESRAFAAIVDDMGTSARNADGPLVREVMGRISRDPGQIMARLDGHVGTGLPFYEVLAEARTLLDDRARQADAKAFKNAMLHLAQGIARARPIVGRRTSAEEARSIRFIGEQLGVGDRVAVEDDPASGRTTASA
jgi:hypothetical protein